MSTARLSSTEIVNELLSALTDDGWLTTSTAPAGGPGPVSAGSGLATIAQALHAHSHSRALPPASTRELERAAEAADQAKALENTGDSVALYSALGASLAYLIQARNAGAIPDSPEPTD